MFGFFKTPLHEPVSAQHADLMRQPGVGQKALHGLDCDVLPGASGPFGRSRSNPIPVNGIFGALKYLAKLRLDGSGALIYHRMGSVPSDVAEHPIDAYEVVDVNATRWDVLFVDVYHPRRSNHAPEGYSLMPYDKKMGEPPTGYGTNMRCDTFPAGVPQALLDMDARLLPMAKRVAELLSRRPFERPEAHWERLTSL